MIEIVRAIDNPTPNKERWITNWNLLTNIHNEGRLIGKVNITSQEVPLAEGASIRMTETSPIKSINGKDITTSSNSVYHLGIPSIDFIISCAEQKIAYRAENPLWFIKDRL